MDTRDDGDGTTRPASLEDVRRDVCDFLAEELEKNPSGFAGSHRLVEDLGADSVVLLALFERLQRRYRVRANIREMAKSARGRRVVTVDDLCALVLDFLEGRFAPPQGSQDGTLRT
jgi:acyl carrier protein